MKKLENFKQTDPEKLEIEKRKNKLKFNILNQCLQQCFGYLNRYFVVHNNHSDLKTKGNQLLEKIILS